MSKSPVEDNTPPFDLEEFDYSEEPEEDEDLERARVWGIYQRVVEKIKHKNPGLLQRIEERLGIRLFGSDENSEADTDEENQENW